MRTASLTAAAGLLLSPFCLGQTLQPLDPRISGQLQPPAGPDGPGYDMDWFTIDGGGALNMSGGAFSMSSTTGQPDAGLMSGGDFVLGGGFWFGVLPSTPCYANCDGSTSPPILNVNDFICFQSRFAQGCT